MSSTTVPNPPTFVTASSGGTQATISWVVPTVTGGSDITSYTVTSTPIDGLTTAVTGITNINSNTVHLTQRLWMNTKHEILGMDFTRHTLP